MTDEKTAKNVLLSLSETVAARLRKHGKKAELISVSIKDSNLRTVSHQTLLPAASDITMEIYGAACRLFDELWDQSPIRHLGVHAGRLGEARARQLNIFDKTDYEKLEKLDTALDDIRRRHGQDAVMRASFLKSPLDHMSGGISREKRTVDYTKEEILLRGSGNGIPVPPDVLRQESACQTDLLSGGVPLDDGTGSRYAKYPVPARNNIEGL